MPSKEDLGFVIRAVLVAVVLWFYATSFISAYKVNGCEVKPSCLSKFAQIDNVLLTTANGAVIAIIGVIAGVTPVRNLGKYRVVWGMKTGTAHLPTWGNTKNRISLVLTGVLILAYVLVGVFSIYAARTHPDGLPLLLNLATTFFGSAVAAALLFFGVPK